MPVEVASRSRRLPLIGGSSSRSVGSTGAYNPTKITYLIGSLARGGAEGQLLELLRRLDRSRWEPSLVLFDGSTAERAAGLVQSSYSLRITSGGNSRSRIKGVKAGLAAARLARHLLRDRPLVVHAILPAACILAAPAVKFAGVPVFVVSRRSLVGCYREAGLLAGLDRLAMQTSDFALGNSRAVREELVRLDGIPAERTATIYNGVDTERFKPGDRRVRQAYGWTEENVVFGIVANFIPYKRHTDFVRAAALIAEQVPAARFLMVGEDRGILPALRKQINAAGLESRFAIIPGSTQPEKLYPAMDVYICTSQTEGFSNVLLEAAASGAPLIATQVGGNPEIVFPNENGYLVPAGAPDQVAQMAVRLAQQSALRRSLGHRARAIVEERFSLDAMVRRHEHLYEHLLASRNLVNSVQN